MAIIYICWSESAAENFIAHLLKRLQVKSQVRSWAGEVSLTIFSEKNRGSLQIQTGAMGQGKKEKRRVSGSSGRFRVW